MRAVKSFEPGLLRRNSVVLLSRSCPYGIAQDKVDIPLDIWGHLRGGYREGGGVDRAFEVECFLAKEFLRLLDIIIIIRYHYWAC